jgi:hypothetical protein
MIKKYLEFILEDNEVDKNYNETSWTMDINGKEKTITIHMIQDFLKDEPIVDIKVEDIKDKCIHLDKKDKKTLERAQKSDLKYPIIICKNLDGTYGMIIDGHHRLKKAIDNEVKNIKAKILDLKKAPSIYKKMFK